jgi:lipopolysaccharide/colanic/teichoic acid biosynthesis glycosyltransferase
LLRPETRFTKRLFDLILMPALILIAPLIWARGRKDIYSKLWAVFVGKMTLVGATHSVQMSSKSGLYVGKEGIWTLAHLSGKNGDQAENTDVYYAKNSTRFLDLEILLKSIFFNE